VYPLVKLAIPVLASKGNCLKFKAKTRFLEEAGFCFNGQLFK